jgi:N4-gp56 family major capsid protein
MKKFQLYAAGISASCALFTPWALLLAVLCLANWSAIGATLGTSYPEINTTTLANYVSANAYVQEQLWVRDVLDTNGANYQSCPFADNMTGRIKIGKATSETELKKAIVEITDTSKVNGDTINIFATAGIGGEGATGDNVRNGTEAQIVTGNMQVKIGNQIFAVGYKQSAVDKSMIGREILKNAKLQEGLRNLHQTRKNDTIIYRMMQAAGYGVASNASGSVQMSAGTPSANFIYPVGVTNRAALRSANTLDLPTIMAAGEVLPGQGALPMSTAKDGGGSVAELFIMLTPDKAVYDLESDPTLTQVLQYAWDRGKTNPIFAGGLTDIRGHGLYRWIHRDHANYNAIGSPLMPRAKLSVATNGSTTTLNGGGVLNGASSDTTAQWFRYFSNAPVIMYGGINNIAATTHDTRYVMTIGSGGYSIWSYTVNNGNALTVTTVSSTVSYVHNPGDLIVECNAAGAILCRSIMFGAQAVVGGNGVIMGTPAGPQQGVLRRQELDLGNDVAIGVEGCAGYAAVSRAGDNTFPGFVIVEHALSANAVPGAPTV